MILCSLGRSIILASTLLGSRWSAQLWCSRSLWAFCIHEANPLNIQPYRVWCVCMSNLFHRHLSDAKGLPIAFSTPFFYICTDAPAFHQPNWSHCFSMWKKEEICETGERVEKYSEPKESSIYREAKSIMVMSLPVFTQSEKFELFHASPMACSDHIRCQVKEWISNFLQTRKDYISSTQKCHTYVKNIQAHSVSSSFIPWQKCCICFEEESCHSRWTMGEQDSRTVPRATFFYLSYGHTHHKCLTFGTHDMDSCKLQYSLGFREAAWVRRMNSAELTSSLTHLPLWMPQSAAGQEPRGRYLQTLALLQLLFLVPN